MAKQTINNKENAFSVRTKLNENFTELYNHMVTSFNGWGYQDFPAGSITTTSVTITANSNGTGFTFSNTNIINSSAVIVRTSDNNKVPYTGTTTLFSSKVSATGNTGDAVTLSGIPNASWGDCRIFFRYTYEKIPTGYTMAPKFVSSQVLDALDESFVTDETLPNEIEDHRFDSVKYNLTPGTTTGIGERQWDVDNLTTSLTLPDGGIIQDGQEIFDYYHNLSGTTLVNGDVVSIAGASGNRTAVTLCDATNPLLAGGVIGMVTVPQILPNEVGRITKFGKIRGLNTDAYTEGTAIYVDPLNPGKWTSIQPEAPNYCICVGIIDVKHPTVGVVDLKLVSLPKLQDLSDINGTPLSTIISGQVPVWHHDTKVFDFDNNLYDYWKQNGNTLGSKKTLGSADNQDFGIITNNTERLTVLKGGNIGIGTITPSVKLTIKKDDQEYAQFGDVSLWDIVIGVAANTSKISGLDFKNFNSTGQIRLMARNDNNDYIAMNAMGTNSSATFFGQSGNQLLLFGFGKRLAIGTFGSDPLILGTSNTERARIDTTGNLGLGTAIPRTKLDVNGLIYSKGTYAEIHNHDSSTSQSIPTGTTYTKLTNFTDNGESNNCTADAANDKIIITKTGRYRIDGSFNFTCGTNNVEWFLGAFLNGVEMNNVHITRKIGTAGDVGSASFTGFINVVTVPVDLDVRARHDNIGTVNLTMSYSNLNAQYIGD